MKSHHSQSRLGLITTGGGPRPEYDQLHAELLAHFGLPGVTVLSRHCLDGLDEAEVDALAPRDDQPAVHANVRTNSSESRTILGEGWRDVWIDRSLFLDRAQFCIDSLVDAKADAIILGIAEEIPGFVLNSPVPVILPQLAVSATIESFVRTRRNVRIAAFCYSARQRDQQQASWSRSSWMESASVAFFEIANGWEEAAREALRFKPTIAVLWGYGMGLIGGDSSPVSALGATLGVPVLIPHVLSALSVRPFLMPAIEPREFLS